jgi:23S rRNA U2552 (ribose-2'-O)-methylase RlmE/FtsJ
MFDITYTRNIKNIHFNNVELYNSVNGLKKYIDNIHPSKWNIIRTIISKYDVIGNRKLSRNIKKIHNINYISRAYFKLWEILNKYENDFKLKNNKDKINIVCLCEAPGGFTKCLMDYRNNNEDIINAISIKSNDIKWKFDRVNICYGDERKNHNGNMYNPEIIDYFIKHVGKENIDFVTGDGGIRMDNIGEKYKGVYHNRLFLCEIYVALNILKQGGSFVLKMYDLCNKPSLDLLHILNIFFEKVVIEKPKTSREMNNEIYIVCHNKKKIKIFHSIILKNLYSIIKRMWEMNDNKIFLGNILMSNKLLNDKHTMQKIKKKLWCEKRHLKKIFKYKNKHNNELLTYLDDIKNDKIKYAYEWMVENNF